MVKVDIKRKLKHLYDPSDKEVSFVNVPQMSFVMVDGSDDSNKTKEC